MMIYGVGLNVEWKLLNCKLKIKTDMKKFFIFVL